MKITDTISKKMLILGVEQGVYLLNILYKQWCKVNVSKSVVTTVGFTIEDKNLIRWLWVKNMQESTSARCFPTEDETLMG